MLYINNFAVYNPDSIRTARNSCDNQLLAVFLVQMLLSSTFLRGSNGGAESCAFAPNGTHRAHTVCAPCPHSHKMGQKQAAMTFFKPLPEDHMAANPPPLPCMTVDSHSVDNTTLSPIVPHW